MRTITISESIKGEIAARVVEQAHPGYMADYQGEWFVVNGLSVQHRQGNAPWNPWPDSADVISVDDLVNIYGGAEEDRADFSIEASEYSDEEQVGIAVEFALGYVPDSYDAEAYERRYA